MIVLGLAQLWKNPNPDHLVASHERFIVKRDFEVVREILLAAEGFAAGASGYVVQVDGYPQSVVDEHAELMISAGLLEGKALRGSAGLSAVHIRGLTWAGHDFLDASRDNTLWAKAKKKVLDKGASVTFDLLLAWLKKEAADRLGLS